MNKRYLAGLSLALAALTASAFTNLPPGKENADAVLYRIRAKDCPGAVARLNEGLAKSYPEVFLVAGTMYDNGICVKPDWKKAVHFYVRAYDGGNRDAASRLVAGFAAPEHGPDIGAALWWASRPNSGTVSSSCTVSAQAMNDPDKFVAELQGWSRQRLEACNYIAGVMATLGGEIRYPDKAANYNLGSKFTLRFLPAVPRIDIKDVEVIAYQPGGVSSGDMLRDRESNGIPRAFEDEIRRASDLALKRYPQPKGIDPAAAGEMSFDFHQVIY